MRRTNEMLERLLQRHRTELSEREGLSAETIRESIQSGTMVLLANQAHAAVKPVLVGQPASIKVNANIGTSPFMNDPDLEMRKLRACAGAGAHTVMDLSTGGDLDRIRVQVIGATELPVGTVPLYSVAQKYIARQRDPAGMQQEELFEEIEKQAEQGVDFMTLHCGVSRKAASLARKGGRRLGIVSRGGSLLARWMEENNRENPLLESYDRILDICLRHNVTISLGDGLRPGAGSDAGDAAQWAEVLTLGELAGLAGEQGVQVMIEGPGHVPLGQIQSQIQVMKQVCKGAPLYVLGPLTTDIAAGYDHIAGAIGGAMAGYFGADFLCYVTPAEHLTLPDEDDVWQGVKASLLAAHSAEVSLGRSRAVERNDRISKARADLDWEAIASNALDPGLVRKRREQFASREECAMCGEYCAVKLQR